MDVKTLRTFFLDANGEEHDDWQITFQDVDGNLHDIVGINTVGSRQEVHIVGDAVAQDD